tara:strand:+ start:146798 stop:148510 length:1713 start_codon:yes stop_codon:yes gene_type:complete
MYLTGVLQAFGIVVITTLFNVYIRVNSLLFDIEPIVFACTYLIATALTLSIFAGPGRFVSDTLKTPATWFYGFILVGTFTVDIYLVKYISGTELSVLSRIAVPVSIILAFLLLSRKPVKTDLFNVAALCVGLTGVLFLQPIETLKPVLILGVLSAILQAVVFMLSETHKQSVNAQQTGNLRDRARVVGFVTFITSMIFFILALGLSFIKMNMLTPELKQQLSFIPEISKFTHAPTIWAGFIFGLCLSPFTRYFQWSSTYKIKTENVLTVLAIIPLTTLACEWLLSFHPLFKSNQMTFDGSRGIYLFALTFIMAAGAWYSAYLRLTKNVKITNFKSFKKTIKKSLTVKRGESNIQQVSNAMDDYEIIQTTLEYTEDDKEKASELLGISKNAITVLYEAKGSLALTADASQEMARSFRRNISSCDALTGLNNRPSLMAEIKSLSKQATKFTTFLLDLDKFKPVNDTYGHEAGDEILKEVANRLTATLPNTATIARIGGDEFVVLIKCDEEKANLYIDKINTAIDKPFKISAVDTDISIGVSIGTATYPTDATTAKNLLKIADGNMYEDKDSS